MSRNKIAINEDWLVRVESLKDNTGAIVNTASLTWQIINARTGAVLGQGTLTSIDANGNYEGTIPDSVTSQLAEAGHYHLIVSGSDAGRNIYRRIELDPYYRGND